MRHGWGTATTKMVSGEGRTWGDTVIFFWDWVSASSWGGRDLFKSCFLTLTTTNSPFVFIFGLLPGLGLILVAIPIVFEMSLRGLFGFRLGPLWLHTFTTLGLGPSFRFVWLNELFKASVPSPFKTVLCRISAATYQILWDRNLFPEVSLGKDLHSQMYLDF